MDEVFESVNPGMPTEFRYRKLDGTWIYLEAIGSNQFENPGIQGIVLTLRDITERKHVEKQLQNTLESLRKAVGTTIQVMVSAIEARDPYTAGHQVRSANLVRTIAPRWDFHRTRSRASRWPVPSMTSGNYSFLPRY